MIKTFFLFRTENFPSNIRTENCHTVNASSPTSGPGSDSSWGKAKFISPLLPSWMHDKHDLICPKNSIKKTELIGTGQFGTVHKGTFHHGNAM